MISPKLAYDAEEPEPTSVAPLSNDVISQRGKDEQVTSVHGSNEMATYVAETNMPIFTCSNITQSGLLGMM